MPFVKLDCGILDSTLWIDIEAREMFVTILLMAEPFELLAPAKQMHIRSFKYTGFIIPKGWYGFVPAAGVGITRRCGIDIEEGLNALERLSKPEVGSRTPDFEGRRVARMEGGFLVLNYDKYRQRDYTGAERAKRYRERKSSRRDVTPSHRDITQAEVEADSEVEEKAYLEAPLLKNMPPTHSPNGKLRVNSPCLSEAIEFGKTINLPKAECEAWHDHFASNGWKISGKTPMKDWKASMRTWKRNHEAGSFRSKQPSKPTIPKYQDDRGEDDPL